jgi:hypothetical protein
VGTADQQPLLTWLSTPEAYGSGVDRVERIDTHVSSVFLAGDRAYKLKRAVRLPYLDFSTPERRREACAAELRINAAIAPALYRRVATITREADGRFAIDGQGEPVDWLVEMERFEQDALFDRLAGQGRLDQTAVLQLAQAIAACHAAATPCPDVDWWTMLGRVIDDSDACLNRFAPPDWNRPAITAYTAECRQWLARLHPQFRDCEVRGRVRRCHGDLHLRNIVRHRGAVLLFDAIEFSDDLARIDVLYDLAFLIMDFDARGLRRHACLLLNRYLDLAADGAEIAGLAALPLYLSLRAAIRAHVALAAATRRAEAGDRSGALADVAEAQHYFTLATGYLQPPPPCLVAIGGLSGTGKSRLAQTLAPDWPPPPGARVVRSDVVRKRLEGVALTARLPAESYTPAASRRVYGAMHGEIATGLAAGISVIADAVFAAPEEREAVAALAQRAGVPFHGIWLQAPADVCTARVAGRRDDASDATPAVVAAQQGYVVGAIDWTVIDAAADWEPVAAAARQALGPADGARMSPEEK